MGLSNKKIAKLYMIEIALTGLIALILGMFFGILSAQLFQMVLLKLSDIVIEIIFGISFDSMLITALIYIIIYAIFVLKGYLTITRSSVLEMVSATRRNEYVKQKQWILYTKLVVGIFILCTGYYLAIEKGGMEVMVNAMAAVFLVCTGIYLLFGGLIPVLFQSLAKRKRFLYKKERTLWMNNIIFRIKKNYRTYAIVTIMLLCSITALGSGFAMKNRYDNIIHFRDTYTYQIVSSQPNLFDEYSQIVEHNNEITYSSQASILFISSQMLASYATNLVVVFF